MRGKGKISKHKIKNGADDFFRALFLYIIGHLLLLTAAIRENGTTVLSRVLLPYMSQKNEMIEAIVASMFVLIVGKVLVSCIFESEED